MMISTTKGAIRFAGASSIFLLVSGIGYTQNTSKNVTYADSSGASVSVAGYAGSSGRTPFWIQSNQFGTIPKTGPAAVISGEVSYFKPLGSTSGHWRVGVGAEATAFISDQNKILLPQAHATLRYKNWELFAGRKKQWVGLADSTLGTGSYAWSTNALPIPKMQLGTIGFVPVPFTKGWISFQGFYSDGWFERERPVTPGLRLHQKSLYGRIGKPHSKLKLYGGFNHQVQWSGKSDFNTIDGEMPKGFKNYLNVIFGTRGAENASHFDETNRVGNHLGSIDLAMEIETEPVQILIYRQHIYEDGSLFWLNNIADGLNGVRFKRKKAGRSNFEINTILLEYLHTKSQGGPDADDNLPGWKRGKDDYFNNGQVRDGWSYSDRTIGTPFITPTSDTRWNWPNYANFFTSNNRVAVMHVGVEGTLLRQVSWLGKFSYARNFGVYDSPFEGSPAQFSALLSLQTQPGFVKNTVLKVMLATDLGDLYPRNYGAGISVTRLFSY
ncbi:capsule assembly Wzi family protein [Dyadobacter sp. CY343]|uniref:capsule assembly Wzi family protein n=1 Tax=Dyadobacter sp. CY343 TaxID=2907299 RepID=UPI001F1EFC67|nr:capsule assembly Wzi family protein [Dyadobacter sp. CY343]MCE7062227.1 capsule assembly Wzi family protein [Dyadobacter sp. CY343]